jgi:hypothetical protein
MVPRRLLSLCLLFLLIASVAAPAAALNAVREEVWSYDGAIPVSPQSSVVNAAFFADVADMDVPSRVVFSVGVTDGAGMQQTLLRYRWGQWTDIPGPGTPINVFVSFSLSCDGQGNLLAEPIEARFGYCSAGQTDQENRVIENVETFMVKVPERFGLVLLDRIERPGANPPPADAFGCAAGAPGLSAKAALGDLARQKGERARILDLETGSIGLYFDPEGNRCTGTIVPGQPGTVYVVAKMSGMSVCGIAGAEFRFTGIPSSWSVYPVADPDILAIGDPLGDGVTMGFLCKRPENSTIVLFRVLVTADAEEHDLQFNIEMRNPPTSQTFECPQLVLCDNPMFTKVCVAGFSCTVNATKPSTRPCAIPVAIRSSTWGGVKSLFR